MKKFITLLFAMVLTFSMMGCGLYVDEENLEGVLKIEIIEGGYGNMWLTKTIEDYQKINPNVEIKFDTFIGNEAAWYSLMDGPDVNETDLYIGGSILWGDFVEQGDKIVAGYDPVLADLTDIYNGPAYGEKNPIKDKMIEEYESAFKYSPDTKKFPEYASKVGKVYTLPWAYGASGLILNKDIFDAHSDWFIPRTSNELIELVNKISADRKNKDDPYPFIWSGSNAAVYWRYVTDVWMAQWDGVDGWDRLMATKDKDGNYSNSVFKSDGMVKSLEVLSTLILPENCYPNSIGMRHTDSQVQFLRGKAAMIPCGDWMYNETKNSDSYGDKGPDECFMIRTPMLSEIGTRYGISEEQLREVVDAIDSGKDSCAGVENDVFNAIAELRKITFNASFNHNIFAPAYAKELDLAKDFIRFMLSEKGLQNFTQYADGLMPYRFDIPEDIYNNIPTFSKSVIDITRSSEMIQFNINHNPIYYRNNLDIYNGYSPELILGSKNLEDRKTPTEIVNLCYDFVFNRWNSYLRTAGLR